MDRNNPPPAERAKAGLRIVVTVAVIVSVFLILRMYWHAAVLERDPESLEAPDRAN